MHQSTVTCHWRKKDAQQGYAHGVSLHSHTSCSKETLNFLAEMGRAIPFIQRVLDSRERVCANEYGLKLDFNASYWTPVLTPKLAYDLERSQIEELLDLPALVSITDHDDIGAPQLLRTVPSARHIPVSLEWTAPWGKTAFHLGIHNLPSATAISWVERLAAFTAEPSDEGLCRMLEELNAEPNVLVVFNHPLWDLYRLGADAHRAAVTSFLVRNNHLIHALELNGLRNWKENEAVIELANLWNQIVISGGDRHGTEPNANINLTDATNFTGFVHEVRQDRISHVHFMPQYAEPWKHRILDSTLCSVRNYPDFPEGSQRWDDRVFHPDHNGNVVPISSLWAKGRPPSYLRISIGMLRLLGCKPIFKSLKLAMNEPRWGGINDPAF